MATNYKQLYAIQEANRVRWLKVRKDIPNCSGVYFLTRTDENGFRYAYVGQALHILDRLVQHLSGYQHIDLSLKKHGLYNQIKNRNGWYVGFEKCDKETLDQLERYYIKQYADKGYQLRNATLGGQDKGKNGLDNSKQPKSYSEGVKMGYLRAEKEIAEYFIKYLDFVPKKGGKVVERKYNELKERLGL